MSCELSHKILNLAHGVSGIGMEIAYRNDNRESRESIADWLESLGY